MDRTAEKIEMVAGVPRRRGKADFIKHLQGERLTRGRAIEAHCFECSGYYIDGAICEMNECALYPFTPYKGRSMSGNASYSDQGNTTGIPEGVHTCEEI